MKRLFVLFVSVLATTYSILGKAYYPIDNIYYNYRDSDLTAGVTYCGSSYWETDEYSDTIVIPDTIICNNKTYRVTRIESSAFRESSVVSVTIGKNVTDIEGSAFRDCFLLCSINIGNSVISIAGGAFYNCYNLQSVIIPNSVIDIGSNTFAYCTSLTSLTIGRGVKSIGAEAFKSCSKLTKVNIINLESWCNIDFADESANPISGDLVINDSVVEHLIIPDNIDCVKDYTFLGCNKLKSIELPNTITSIGRESFAYCMALTSMTIPNNVTKIGYMAFFNCTNLIYVEFPKSIATLGTSIFLNCDNLDAIYVPCGELDRIKTLISKNEPTTIKKIKYHPSYSLDLQAENGEVVSSAHSTRCDSIIQLTAIPNTNYHFTQWSDGVVDNPRTIVLTQDSIFIAEFVKNPVVTFTESLEGHIEGDTTTSTGIAAEYITFTAEPNYGYHFTGWSDGVLDNPRTIYLTCDTTFTAIFAPNQYSIDVSCYEQPARVEGDVRGSYDYLSELTFSVTPHYGYHFTQWNDGNTDNPRTITITQDTAFGAIIVKNQYQLSLVCDENRGTISGEQGKFEYLSVHECEAIPNYGYHFTQWSDGHTGNPRLIELMQDTIITAEFEPNIYYISGYCYDDRGRIEGQDGYPYLSTPTIEVIPEYGYHFLRWFDGNTDNPRTLTLTQDTIINAELAPNIYTLNVECESSHGSVVGTGEYEYLSQVEIQAIPKYGYHFAHWSDGAMNSPRIIEITEDITITAVFAPNVYSVSAFCDPSLGQITEINGQYNYLTNLSITATPTYGYHLDHWEDTTYHDVANAISPSEAATLTARLAVNGQTSIYYYIRGYVTGKYGTYSNSYYLSDTPTSESKFIAFKTNQSAQIGDYVLVRGYLYNYKGTTRETYAGGDLYVLLGTDEIVMEVTSYTDNPHVFNVKSDTHIGAIFAKNIYALNTNPNNALWGSISGGGSYEYLSEKEIEATPNYGYHFTQWSDGNANNPRMIVLTQDTIFTAEFAANPRITFAESPYGHIEGDTTTAADVLADYIVITAVPDYGYHFTQWSDGVKANPRTIYLTRDTTFTAEFAVDKSGTCGVDNQLTWIYDDNSKTLTINGSGSLTENYTFGVEAPNEMVNLIIGNEVTAIGDRAFYRMTTINHLVIGGNVASIGSYAFAECKNFDDITCYAVTVPTITASTFANVGNKQYIYLFVSEGRQRAYLRDTYWGEFDVQIKNAETITDPIENVVIIPTENTAEITWPVVTGADSYEIAITTSNGDVVCTLIFNAQGQLTGIAFAPAREKANKQQTEGFRFTITGLASGTTYDYMITAKDANDQSIDTKSGSFSTTNSVPTSTDVITSEKNAPQKVLYNGQIYILRGDKTYTVTGQQVK